MSGTRQTARDGLQRTPHSRLAHTHFACRPAIATSNWNEQGASVRLLILPPWWSTWWFRAMSFAAVLAMFLALYQYRLYQMVREFNARLEGRVDERLRVARDLHDTLLQSFQGVLLRFQAVHSFLPGRVAEAKHVLETALDDAAKLLPRHAMRFRICAGPQLSPAVWRKPLKLWVRKWPRTEELRSGARLLFRWKWRARRKNLHPILRDEIYRIARKRCAMRSTTRGRGGSKSKSVMMPHRFRVRVRDDGIGIDASVLSQEGRPGHWGLTRHARAREECRRTTGGLERARSRHGDRIDRPSLGGLRSHARRRFRLFKSKVGTNS